MAKRWYRLTVDFEADEHATHAPRDLGQAVAKAAGGGQVGMVDMRQLPHSASRGVATFPRSHRIEGDNERAVD